MRKARWLAYWKCPEAKPAICHVISRVVGRRFVFGDKEREAFRMFMRMYENFSGCRALSHCVMSNHFHILLEVPPMREGGLGDEVLLKRLSALHTEAFVAAVAAELKAKVREQSGLERSHRNPGCLRSHRLDRIAVTGGSRGLQSTVSGSVEFLVA